MNQADLTVRRILDHLEKRIDLAHVERARARQAAALSFQDIDRPPLTVYLPYEGTGIAPYSVAEAMADPARMMANELLIGFTSLYHAVELRDDAPYALRPNFGTTIIASMFGAEIAVLEDNPPWVQPLEGIGKIRAIAGGPLPDLAGGLWPRVMDQYAYFHEAVRHYPLCSAALQFTLPDLQGPFSVAELLWGGGIYLALRDEAELVRALLERITEQILRAYRALGPAVRDVLGSGLCYQHAVGVRGSLLIRDDSIVNLSRRDYREFVLPFDRRLCEAVGGAGIHFCGNGMHQVGELLSIGALRSLDLGQPEMLDIDALYAQAAPAGVALLRLAVPHEALRAAELRRRFPRGVNFAVRAASVAEGHHLLAQYQETQ